MQSKNQCATIRERKIEEGNDQNGKNSSIFLAATIALSAVAPYAVAAQDSNDDTVLPNLNDGSWYETMHTDFTQIQDMAQLRETGWVPSPHGLRNYEYWCDQMIDFTDEGLIIHSEQQNDHRCDVCGVREGVFTSGIETREMVDGKVYQNRGYEPFIKSPQ